MKTIFAAFLLVLGVLGPSLAGDYRMENRPTVEFKGGFERMSPYPQGKRAASVWKSDACFRDCASSCSWKMEYCVRDSDADSCRPHFDNCNRSCQRECRSLWSGPVGGPLVGLIDWY